METLRVGGDFPLLQACAVDGSTFRVPDDQRDGPAVLLFYRGHW